MRLLSLYLTFLCMTTFNSNSIMGIMGVHTSETGTDHIACDQMGAEKVFPVLPPEPANVTILVNVKNMNFDVRWHSSGLATADTVPYYYLYIDDLYTGPDKPPPLCYAVKNSGLNFSFHTATHDVNLVSNRTFRVVVSSTLDFHPGTYVMYFVRVPEPGGHDDLNNWSTPVVTRLLKNCSLIVSFVVAEPKFNVNMYKVVLTAEGRVDLDRSIRRESSPAVFTVRESAVYEVSLLPALSDAERLAGRQCLCKVGFKCASCLSLATTIVVTRDNVSGCTFLPTPTKFPPILRKLPPPVITEPDLSSLKDFLIPLTIVMVIGTIVSMYCCKKLRLCRLNIFVNLTAEYNAVLLYGDARVERIAHLIADWLESRTKYRIMTASIRKPRIALFYGSRMKRIRKYVKTVDWIILLHDDVLSDSFTEDNGGTVVTHLKELYNRQSILRDNFLGIDLYNNMRKALPDIQVFVLPEQWADAICHLRTKRSFGENDNCKNFGNGKLTQLIMNLRNEEALVRIRRLNTEEWDKEFSPSSDSLLGNDAQNSAVRSSLVELPNIVDTESNDVV